jgi:hypothetical protein
MWITRTIIIPTILTLGVAGSLLSGSAITAAAQHPASVHAPTMYVASVPPVVVYHG